MPLGMVGLGLGDIVLDGDPSPQKGEGRAAPSFRPLSVAVKWLD